MSQKHCAQCGRDFPDDVLLCDDCHEPLVQADPDSSTDQPPSMLLLTTLADPAEATILTNALRAEGIDATTEEMDLLEVHMVDTRADTRGIPVMVNAHDADRALEILKLHREGRLALSENEIPTGDEPRGIPTMSTDGNSDSLDRPDMPPADAPASDDGPPSLVRLVTVSQPTEAMVLTHVLHAHDIDAVAEDFDLMQRILGDMVGYAGGILITVPADQLDHALEILQLHREGRLTLADDQLPEPEDDSPRS